MGRITMGDVYVAGAYSEDVKRLRAENKRLAVDSVALDKVMVVIDRFRARNADTLLELYRDLRDIRTIIDEMGD